MTKHSMCRQALCAVFLAGILFGLGFDSSAQSQITSPAPASTDAASGTAPNATAYDVISIKPDKSGDHSGGWKSVPDGFVFTNMTLQPLVYSAYGIIMDSQLKGLPEWAESEHYDIEAKVDAGTAAEWQKMTWKERVRQEQPLSQALLADRCQFKGHQETRELPVYDLVIAKGGLKMKEAPPNEPGWQGASTTPTTSTMKAHAIQVNTIANILSNTAGRMVVDKTGLGDKKFDFELKWTPDDRAGASNAPDAPPSVFTALEEQLGLKLVPAKGPVEVLVIDHMERPSAN